MDNDQSKVLRSVLRGCWDPRSLLQPDARPCKVHSPDHIAGQTDMDNLQSRLSVARQHHRGTTTTKGGMHAPAIHMSKIM
eukprot:1234222-Karenia_brevis.AAC.1